MTNFTILKNTWKQIILIDCPFLSVFLYYLDMHRYLHQECVHYFFFWISKYLFNILFQTLYLTVHFPEQTRIVTCSKVCLSACWNTNLKSIRKIIKLFASTKSNAFTYTLNFSGLGMFVVNSFCDILFIQDFFSAFVPVKKQGNGSKNICFYRSSCHQL